MEATNIITLASDVITTGITTTGQLVTALPFMLLSMGFIFGRKFIGIAKNLTMQGRGRRRG